MKKPFVLGFKKLIAWQTAHELTLEIYSITKDFPITEKFGIISQLRRASSSIGAQIAEGSHMPTLQHRKLYYDRAYASRCEVQNFIELSKDLGMMNEDTYARITQMLAKASYLLYKLSASTSEEI